MRGGPSIDEMTGVSRKLRRLAVEHVAGKADRPKSLGKPSLARCSDQSSAEPCGVGVDQDDAIALARPKPARCNARVVLPAAPFRLRSAMIMFAPQTRQPLPSRGRYRLVIGEEGG
jgi:hypothetical protein